MSVDNPFDNVPEDVAQAPGEPAQATTPATAVRPAGGTSEGKVVVTLKGGRDFDAPWIVVHADDVDDALAQVNSKSMAELMRVSQAAAKHFSGSGGGGNTGNGATPASVQSRVPEGAAQAPNGQTRTCAHGLMEFKSGTSAKTGKPYQLFSCTAPRESQCKAQFLN